MRGTAILVIVLLAGCAHPPASTGDVAAPQGLALPEPDLDHDHNDPRLHDHAQGLELAAFVDAGTLLGTEDARLSDIQFHGDLAAVAVNGRVGSTSGGFFLLNVADPLHPALLSRYRSGSEDNWYTKFSPDGRYVFLTANGNTAANAALNGTLDALRHGVATGPARGVHVVDIRDPRAPQFVGAFLAPVRAINVAPWMDAQGQAWLAASVIQDRPNVAGPIEAQTLNYVSILRFDENPPRLTEVKQWRPDGNALAASFFAHDLAVERHPIDGRTLLFAAYWDGGAFLVDVSDPATPRQLAHIPSMGDGDHVHTFKPHPGLLDGVYYAVLAPETFGGERSGTYRLYDITDPAHVRQIGSWTVPGDLRNTQPLLLSPHEFALANGRLYTSNYHLGSLVFELPTLRLVGVWQNSVGDPARTHDWAVDHETLVPYRGYAWAVDMGSGVLALREAA